jgi:hypothetical protein
MNDNSRDVFIIDSNVLIEPYKTYYSFNFVPEFWNFIEQRIKAKKIIILDMVYDEIAVGSDTLSLWIKNIQNLEPLNHKTQELIKHYADILDFIQTSGFYKIDALRSWSVPSIADPFLVAAAIRNNYTVITGERPNTGLNKTNPSPKVKIPDICAQFNVKWGDLFYMLAQLGFRRAP